MFQRLTLEVPEDESVSVIAMIVSDIKFEKVGQNLKWTFWILQDEFSYTFRVTFLSDSTKNELKLSKLNQVMGTIVFISRMYRQDSEFQIDLEDDLAVVAMRPNVFQIDKFLKDRYSLGFLCFK